MSYQQAEQHLWARQHRQRLGPGAFHAQRSQLPIPGAGRLVPVLEAFNPGDALEVHAVFSGGEADCRSGCGLSSIIWSRIGGSRVDALKHNPTKRWITLAAWPRWDIGGSPPSFAPVVHRSGARRGRSVLASRTDRREPSLVERNCRAGDLGDQTTSRTVGFKSKAPGEPRRRT